MICADSKETISAEELCVLTELSDRQHRNIAAAGNFPLPIDGKYQFWLTMRGLLKYYREKNTRTKEGAQNTNAEYKKVQTRLLLLEEAQKLKKMVDRSDVDALLSSMGSLQKAVLYASLGNEYPGKCVGLTSAEIKVYGLQLADRICQVFQRNSDNWMDKD